jgi:uncharacterized protein YqfB (UPF0267 family)
MRNIKIYSVKEIKMSAINEYIAGLDTGYGVEACKQIIMNMYPAVKNLDIPIL